jgi:cellulase/cellobiase CelA1|tara:strand:+ start:1545 stop:2150 length:606 start_codon:yes stop_codon:yes gene_type:complete
MACNLTRGLLVDCKDQIGGLKKIFFTQSYCSDIRASATFNGTNVLQMDTAGFANWDIYGGSTVNVYQYDLRPNLSSVTVNINSDPATGTTFFEQTLSLTLQKLSVAQTNELKLISYNRSQIFVLDNNDNVFLLGMDNGCDISGGTVVTGAAKGDMSGYTLEIRAEEKDPLIWLPATAGGGTAKYPFDGLSDEAALNIAVGT